MSLLEIFGAMLKVRSATLSTLRTLEERTTALESKLLDLQAMKAKYETLIATYEESMRIVTDRVEKKLSRSGKIAEKKHFPLFQR